jgi:parallel beta-helix repeat protein
LYVGGSGPGNYTRIQDAIDNASDENTVFVYDDSSPYHENLIINKSISLIGEKKETTIIDGSSGNIIILIRLTDNVQIQGFTIRNSSRSKINWDYVRGIGIQLLAATFCNISDTIITDTDVGIYLLNYIWNEFTDSNMLSKNIIIKNSFGTALDWGSGYTTIENNDLRLNWYGIIIITTNFNIIMKNNFMWNFRSVLLTPDVIWPDGDPLDEIDHNMWSMNYWGRSQFLHLILGRARVVYDHASWNVRYIEVDWHPAQEPYDIH